MGYFPFMALCAVLVYICLSLSFIFGRGRCAQHHVYIELPFRYISLLLRTAAAAAGRKRLASCCVAPLLFARERSNKRDDLFKRV